MFRTLLFLVVLASLLPASLVARAEPQLIGVAEVGMAPFNNGRPSSDGTILPGARPADGAQEAVYWEVGTRGAEAMVVPLGTLGFQGADFQTAVAASADGSVLVGTAKNADSMTEAYRWTADTGMVGLGFLPNDTFSEAADVSGEGGVVVGNSLQTQAEPHGFRWTQAGGLVDLGDLPGGEVSTRATAVSKDGSTVVGFSRSTNGFEAFRWREAGGMVGLGFLGQAVLESRALDVSADGSVVVGWSRTDNGLEAFRWTEAAGMQTLDGVPAQSQAWSVSSDGSIVLGEYNNGFSGQSGFVWDEVNGFQDLTQLLFDAGVTLNPTWVFPFQQALSISDDGTVLRGTGTENGVGFQDFVVTQLSVPEPSTGLLGAAALATLACLNRRRRPGRRSDADTG